MGKGRLEAFSDGVIAILITIMVLELKVPHGTDWTRCEPLLPVFLTYVLSFVYLGIYWNNHHHMLHAAERINGAILWANLHLLFWLSLVPFVTGWMGENHFAPLPTAVYGVVLLMAGVAFLILQTAIIRIRARTRSSRRRSAATSRASSRGALRRGDPARLRAPSGSPTRSTSCVALMWLVPDRRIETTFMGCFQRRVPGYARPLVAQAFRPADGRAGGSPEGLRYGHSENGLSGCPLC